MKYVYGPVRSRRLGNSLGISTVPYKVCSFDCVYCQLKRTTRLTRRRMSYVKAGDIVDEVRAFFAHKPADMKVDHVTFSGSGEPTLHRSIGLLIRQVKKIARRPVVVITNSSTLTEASVRRDISAADIIVPSLDAVTQDVFEKIDRPAPGVRIEKVIDALGRLRQQFKGQIWLEVMLVRGLNDDPAYLEKMKKVIDRLAPDRVQFNAPVRPPAEQWVKPVTVATLRMVRRIFGPECEIVS
jgi:wyosine [tRNA(Phe)-imidazoG37] synthetase (radical SAM superfamily)